MLSEGRRGPGAGVALFLCKETEKSCERKKEERQSGGERVSSLDVQICVFMCETACRYMGERERERERESVREKVRLRMCD